MQAVHAIAKLSCDVGIPASIRDVGVTEEDIPALAAEASKIDRLLNNNPRWLTAADIETIYRESFAGKLFLE
jgi:alcohol dehydrogenase class IV